MRRSILGSLVLCSFALPMTAQVDPTSPAPEFPKNQWVDISALHLAHLESQKIKIGYPGKVAGITFDPDSRAALMVIPDVGIYRIDSTPKGPGPAILPPSPESTPITGRCETGASLQMDPAGKRLACFMLDGKSGMTLDGKKWTEFKQVGRGWDYASVDWSDKNAATILAFHHESGGQLYLSTDAGKSWTKFAKDDKFNTVGTFDANTFITAKSTGGIARTEDAGKTWKQVSDLHVTSHVTVAYKEKTYLLAKEGLLVSDDKGATWKAQGAPLEATLGPLFKDEKHMIVWGKKGIYETTNAGEEWKLILTYPEEFKKKFNIEWYTNVGWDPATDTFYLSHMGLPAYAWRREAK